ncbi:Petal formation-expressed [Dillenia turbinata]|uniref:Petal formation-expressed n=1 Tax=Dillenia turbinata TaxID=194707 RepID=A0AAN8W837_9MAGN
MATRTILHPNLSFLSSSLSSKRQTKATLQNLKVQKSTSSLISSLKNLPTKDFIHGINNGSNNDFNPLLVDNKANNNAKSHAELYAIMEAISDRSEMHKNIGAQRDNWNRLLLTSINGLALTASTMAGLASLGGNSTPFLALKLCSSLLYISATVFLMVMNKIQPSQLAEEQRNASRLFKQLHWKFQNRVSLGKIDSSDVNQAMEMVLALDKAYPLPLLGSMLDKFPKNVKPATWWPQKSETKHDHDRSRLKNQRRNGWSENLEEEMRKILEVLKRKDCEEYVRLSKIVLRVNKVLAICGPMLTGLGAVGSLLIGSPFFVGSCGVFLGIVCGALASVVNSIEHGGQVGMVFEIYRSSAGFFQEMEESIEENLEEKGENGELFEVKVALQLGRSIPELRELAGNCLGPLGNDESRSEFASKLF